MELLTPILLYVSLDDELDIPSRLDLRHDLEEFVRKYNPGKYEIHLYDGSDDDPLEEIVARGRPVVIT